MEVVRRAPKNGYDNDSKAKYRWNVWKHLSKKAIPILEKEDNAYVLLLPSKEGLEIDTAIKFGIPEERIIAIDENPAIIAVSKWRKKYPKVKYFGCKVSEVGYKIKKKGWKLASANLDFCNRISEELITETNSFLKNTPINDNFSFFVTFMKGRESKALFLLLNKRQSPKIFKHARLGAFYELINLPEIYNHYWACDFEKTYVSNRAPMVYACFCSINGNITSKQIQEKINRIEILGERANYMNKCKTGRNGGYREKAKQVNAIKQKIEDEIHEILSDIMEIKMEYANDKCIIEKGMFGIDHEPGVYLNLGKHYSGFFYNRGR